MNGSTSPSSAASPDPENVFAHVPRTAGGHYLLFFFAAVHRLLRHIHRQAVHGGDDLDVTFLKYPFLVHYNKEICAHSQETKCWEIEPAWWESQITAWESAALDDSITSPRLPLQLLAKEASLSFSSRVAMLLVGLVEEDSRFGTVIADLQAPLPHRRPTLELISRAMIDNPANGSGNHPKDPSVVCRELLSAGFLEALNRESPRSEWSLRIPPILWDAIRGQSVADPAQWCRLHESRKFPKIDALALTPEFQKQLARLPGLFAAENVSAIVLRGMPGSDRLRLIGAIAALMGRPVLEVNPPAARDIKDTTEANRIVEQLGPLCCLTGAMPVLRYDLAPGETVTLPSLTAYKGPVGVILGHEGGVTGRAIDRAVTLIMPIPNADQRRQLWQTALADKAPPTLDTIVERFHLPAGHIREAAVLATTRAALDGRSEIECEDVRLACRSLNRQTLDTLATRLECHGSWKDLALSDNAIEKMKELQRRCHQRENLLTKLGPAFGPATTGNRGVRALLTGPSGTGKTLAARILAAELGKDLYRIDLAAVINKYIGETEKNMHRVLSQAESHDVVVLMDEGDSHMSSRTDVTTANDRHANMETNYLLQRLENYQGILLVTTNLGDNIDQAFQRRMEVVINFTPPGAIERLRIWQMHLPENQEIPLEHLQEISMRCQLTGGQIRNAAQAAALTALQQGVSMITTDHLTTAVFSEYRKAGAVCPLPGARAASSPPSSTRARSNHESFIAAIK